MYNYGLSSIAFYGWYNIIHIVLSISQWLLHYIDV